MADYFRTPHQGKCQKNKSTLYQRFAAFWGSSPCHSVPEQNNFLFHAETAP
jgi:hypothetical protein